MQKDRPSQWRRAEASERPPGTPSQDIERVTKASPNDDLPASPPQTPETIAKIVGYALSELSSDNAHHEFEHLCRHIARRRICSNILPATGPVSGGGDAGADFESLPVRMESSSSRYWQMTSVDKVLFACSFNRNLKKKVAADVAAAAQYPEPVDTLYFFYNRPVKIADRNKLKAAALEIHGIKLEIIDAKAIAEFLADPELLWLAERYLSLPCEIILSASAQKPVWYDSLLAGGEQSAPDTLDTFFQLKSAVRHATAVAERHSDIPRLITHLRRFRAHTSPAIARKAFYEEFVAALRGLNAAEGYEFQVVDYLSAIETLSEPQELEDAAVLLGYARGATARGILHLDESQLKRFRETLLSRLDRVTPKEPCFVRCSLLFTKGYAELGRAYLDHEIPEDTRFDHFVQSVQKVVTTWSNLLREAAEVKLFPVERLTSTVNFFYPYIDTEWFSAFASELDRVVAERAGAECTANALAERGSALLEDEQHMRSLQTFHEALRLSQSAESQRPAVVICLQLAELYKYLGLSHAAKYYGFASCYAALSFPDDELRELAAVGLGVACEADYVSGASLLFFLTYRWFASTASQFRIAGTETYRQEKWATVDYYAVLLARASMLFGPDLHQLIVARLKLGGGEEPYRTYQSELDAMFAEFAGDTQALSKSYGEQGTAAPFSDFARRRTTAWKQLGIEWSVVWPTDFEHERCGEAFCAVVQIVCAALGKKELSTAAERIDIELSVKSTGFAVKTLPSNATLKFSVTLNPASDDLLRDYITAVYVILMRASAMPEEAFKARFEDEFENGLLHRVGVYTAPHEAFRQFYDRDEYDAMHQCDPEEARVAVNLVRAHAEVAGVPALHPDFDEADVLKQVENRYRRIQAEFPFTLQQLTKDAVFLGLVAELRQEGWKDWHILQAVASARLNALINDEPQSDSLARTIIESGEREEYPLTPSSVFTNKELLRRCLQMSQLQTVHGLGLELKQPTPNFAGVDRLLRRFRYWDIDIPHEDPFEPTRR